MKSISVGDAARAALAALEGGPAVALVTVVAVPEEKVETLGRRLLVYETGEVRGTLGGPALDEDARALARRTLAGHAGATTETVAVDGATYRLYVEAQRAPDELVVVGAGHIAVPLARLGVMLGFRTTVLDDREEFATAERFPAEATVRPTDFSSDPFRDVAIGRNTYLVLVTRAHKYDFDCLRTLVEREVEPRYIGMIGSRRRVRAAFHALLEAGVPRERLERIHAPVGLDIDAETPEEIAVSIAAEIIRVRRAPSPTPCPEGGRSAVSMRDNERVLARLLPERGE